MEPLSPYEALELDNDCSIVLELSKDDPLFEKKMKLLQSKGFNSKERINFKRDPDFVTITLKVMLQIARIINLDEVELYFGDDGISSPDDPYSHRNELQALTSILRLIDISAYSSTQMQKDLFQKLHDAIIDMIHTFAGNNSMQPTIIENHHCDKENDLLKWGEQNGIRARLRIAYVKDAGRGAIAREDLKVGDAALEIPASLIISEELLRESDMYHVLKKIEGISSETMLLLWSMKEKHNCNSKFKKYFATLPEEFHTGFSFGLEAKMALSDTLLFEEIIQANNHLHTQYDGLFPILCKEHPDIFPPELYTWEQFLWACELWYSNSMKIMFADGKLRTCLIPIASFFNHSLYPHIVHYGRIDSATNSLKFCLSRPCSAGEECFLSYGNFSSSHLITFYGFVPKGHNPYDIFPLEFEDGTCHMVRATWLSRNNHIFHYGLPTPLLDYLRRLKSPILNTKTLGNLENELEVLEDLLFMFNDLMENLGDADIDDGIETSWDVKLATKFKDIHRGIVSSVLTSCYEGIKLLKIELSKCMEEDIRG
ncbi:uncharacterized protein LOC107410546 isoform X2 [Ziziphus jujuba]|uniref:Uncharacterized protein LOC107410546 isoform X2 n=1 Tax=Ziziphus jujuba TaxID=326968 RepID=A0ABM3I8Y3_ZIZJJ|nr:uncharacterized protein LOC107410546 isoform X2 [Ziziphus jujuba]